MKNLDITFIIAIAICILGLLLFFRGTGYHSKQKKIYAVIILVGLAIVSYFFPLPSCIALGLIVVLYYGQYHKTISSLKMNAGEWESYEEFEKKYNSNEEDEPGCYIMTTYDTTNPTNLEKYITAYVGSSKKIKKEIHSVLNNKMLSRVYSDIQDGKSVYIHIIPTDIDQLDSNQQKLIEMYKGIPYLKSFSEVKK